MRLTPSQIIFRAIVIALLPLAFYYTVEHGQMWITSSLLLGLWIFSIYSMIDIVKKQNKELHAFLDAFEKDDSMMRFTEDLNSSKGLNARFNKIIERYSEVKADKEKDTVFFSSCLSNIPIGVLAFNQHGTVDFCNQSLLDLLDLKAITNVRFLNQTREGLSKQLLNIPANQSQLISVDRKLEKLQLLVRCAKFKQGKQTTHLLTFQNIQQEINQGEMEAWSKLIRVLTHEIINSISPIKILTNSLTGMLEKNGQTLTKEQVAQEDLDETVTGLKAINKRVQGLGKFVDNYRKLAKIPEPQLEVVSLKKLLRHITVLIQPDMKMLEVDFRTPYINPDILLLAEEKLIEQVLINLLRNAVHAAADQEHPRIDLEAGRQTNRVFIRITDNGEGIAEDIIENIFIPFFTTKQEGSGIGLSLSRQIMRKHKGDLTAESTLGHGASFTMQFPYHSNLTSSTFSKPSYEDTST
ncbi:MAG: ATP-binding protein [Cytophagales bacterium]|nr:ATP-binding protein [Cytophagales bacterium]